MVTETLTDKIKDLILDGVEEEPVASKEGPPLWKSLREKGIYDDYITEAAKILGELGTKEKIMEIAFILNARDGLRLVHKFGGRVSVELHTDLAYDLNGILFYGRRFHEISPEHFIVKVPLTATGFIGARELRKMGVPVNFTLGFSARHNYIASLFSGPDLGNVFLGRGRELGFIDLFPQLSDSEYEQIASDEKIQVHSRWRTRSRSDQLAVDTLLNLAGLATFASEQKALDDRIAKLID